MPAHNSKKRQKWLRKNLPEVWEKEVCPPSSPDCNPLDYFVWGITELTQRLIAILRAWLKRSRRWDTMAKACRRFRSRIEAVVAADGDFIE